MVFEKDGVHEDRKRRDRTGGLTFFKNIRSYDGFVRWLYQPTDPSSLGVIRVLFGLLMMADLPEERGGSIMDLRWGDPRDCHFPLFPVFKTLPLPYMGLLYGIMWMGALGIALGYKFKLSACMFGVPYWYLLLLDKSFWNNHSYLFGVVTILLAGTSANHYCSIDGVLDETKRNAHVPYWNYFILKFQFFMLYFLAGLKKTDVEWLEGYSMVNLGRHWVFSPFMIILTTEQIDYLIVHWFGFLLDLTIGFWMLYDRTRPLAMLFCASFHLMNSRLFTIGMFPYVCLATMPLFCEENWPRRLFCLDQVVRESNACIYPEKRYTKSTPKRVITWKHRFVAALLLTHCSLQGFLPYSHFITKGYNNWTNGLYGYSWDMMVHSWDTILVVVKVVDNETGREYFLEPGVWTQNERWSKHADMCMQYAQCLKNNLLNDPEGDETNIAHADKTSLNEVFHKPNRIRSDNISIYIDVWCSLNGRFQQRMYNPNYDLLKAKWSPFEPVEWLLPLLTEYSGLREKLMEIQKDVYSWSNYSDVLFISDFPGLYLENYISNDLVNVTLTVLEGEIFYEIEDESSEQSLAVKLKKGSSFPVETDTFHKIHTVGSTPSCYMYTYVNGTKQNLKEDAPNLNRKNGIPYSPFPLLEDMEYRVENFLTMMTHIYNSIQNILS